VVLLLVVILLIVYASIHSKLILSILFFALGFLASAQVLSYPTIAESNPPAITARSMSIVAILLNLTGFVGQPLFGWLMHLNWNRAMLHGAPTYSAGNFQLALVMLPIAFIAALLMVSRIRETYCHSHAVAGDE